MTKVALVYDFDGTLAPGNMQEYGLLQALGYTSPPDFWKKANDWAAHQDADGILTTQYMLLEEIRKKGLQPTRELFRQYGAQVTFFPGVTDWFARINEYGKSLGLEIQHFIDSSGMTEMIEGTTIAQEFTHIYACSYMYNEQGEAIWPAVAVDYSTKVQFLSKISKGIREVSDSKLVNMFMSEKRRAIPMTHMIYLGDGETDVPSMRTVKAENGHSIAVFSSKLKRLLARNLIKDGRVNYACHADYREGKDIDNVVKYILNGIAMEVFSKTI